MKTLVAPWSDFIGQPIHHGDRLTHQDGTEFVAIRLNGFQEESDAWRAVYDNAPQSVSRLCLQIGDKGRAVLATTPEVSVQDAKEWQPIETAPKTGRHLARMKDGAMSVIVWLSADHPDADGAGWYEHWQFDPVEPTHWMPLPQPPKEQP